MRALTFRKKEKLLGLAFIAPALILFLLFMAYPMVSGLLLSFISAFLPMTAIFRSP